MFWDRFRKQEQPVPDPQYLRPGDCECGHSRCTHVAGKGKCTTQYPPDEDCKDWTDCACQIYIRDEDNDGGDLPETPTPSELEKLYQL